MALVDAGNEVIALDTINNIDDAQTAIALDVIRVADDVQADSPEHQGSKYR
jgi:hypothetical protein